MDNSQETYPTALALAFEKAKIQAPLKKKVPKSQRNERHAETYKQIRNLVYDLKAWEDPGYSYHKIINRFVKLLTENYYINTQEFLRKKLIKNLAGIPSKYYTFCLIFAWFNRLGELYDDPECIKIQDEYILNLM